MDVELNPNSAQGGETPDNPSGAFSEFFKQLTDHSPYSFQEDIANQLLTGKSVVFRAPTGCGKTWTVVAPYLYSRRIRSPSADRLIYALPLRSLASSLHATVVERLTRMEDVITSVKNRGYPGDRAYCSLQIGGEANDPYFEGDLIFCTIDQLLSGYLMMPLSLPSGLGNLVAGALPGSYIVLDEAHLLESGVALGTVIEFLDRFRGLVQFVLMTATISEESLEWLADRLDAKVVTIPDEQIRGLPVQRTKRRTWRWNDSVLNADHVKAAHLGGRTLVIVNQVSRAQELYSKLAQEPTLRNTKIACLHSRFFAEDRQATEQSVQDWFGPKATETNVILITTQVVEAGMDISADLILTDLAPMNSLVQRAGRTARYKDRCEGVVTVFDIESALPYTENDAEFALTRECLLELPASGSVTDFALERTWIKRVHGEREKTDLRRYENLFSRRQQVEKAIVDHDRGQLNGLVRDIDSVNVLLSETPEAVGFSNRRWPVLLSVPRSAIWALSRAIESAISPVWKAAALDDESSALRFRWERVSTKAQLSSAWLLSIGPEAAYYSAQVGLKLGCPGNPVPIKYSNHAPTPQYQYFLEFWADHIQRVLEQAEAMRVSNGIGAFRLGQRLGLTNGQVEDYVRIAVVLHDVGKLSKSWQDTAWKYQTARTGVRRTAPIAHTSKGPDERGPKMPHHAVEGAFASAPFLEQLDGGWAIASAIARHHSPRACESQSFELVPEAQQIVSGFLGTSSRELRNGTSGLERDEFKDLIGGALDDQVRSSWPLYAYIVRRLRLADQAGTKSGVEAGGGQA